MVVGLVREREFYGVLMKSGYNLHIQVGAKLIKQMGLHDRDEVRVVIKKTGRIVPIGKITAWNRSKYYNPDGTPKMMGMTRIDPWGEEKPGKSETGIATDVPPTEDIFEQEEETPEIDTDYDNPNPEGATPETQEETPNEEVALPAENGEVQDVCGKEETDFTG